MRNVYKLFSFIVLASSVQMMSASAADDEWYIGAKTGWNNASSACEAHATSCENDTFGGGVYVGYQLRDWLAFEGGYVYLGSIEAHYPALGVPSELAKYEGEMQGFELVAKPFWQVSEDVIWFFKAGTLAWNMDVIGDEIDFEHTASDNGWSPLLGTGVEYALNRNWSTLLEYQWVNNVGGSSTGGTDVNMVNLGVTYHFASEQPIVPPVPAPAASVPDEMTIVKAQQWSLTGASFANNSIELTSDLKQALQPVVQRLLTYPQATVVINTHADGRGSAAFNQKLTDERAGSVLAYLMEQGGAPTQMRANGYGDSQPIADDSTPEGRSQNRRVEVLSPAFEVEQVKISTLENQQ